MPVDLLDAVYGCLIAGAIGDSLGAPSENMHYTEIRDQFGRIEELLPYDKVAYSTGQPGVVTDDTTLSYYMCLTIVRKGGRITPDDAAATWLNDLNPDRFWSPDKISYLKMMAGVDPWEAGRGNIPSACATMSMIPIGIINAANLYGLSAISPEKRLDLVVTLRPASDLNSVDRLGVRRKSFRILGISTPHIEIPVAAGRDTARMVAVAALDMQLRRLGYDMADEFNQRLLAKMTANKADAPSRP